MADEQTDLPARIGRYAIERTLGQGGMGVVYAARDEQLQRTIALKTLTSLSQDEAERQRLWREARAAASVTPHVMERYAGKNLMSTKRQSVELSA